MKEILMPYACEYLKQIFAFDKITTVKLVKRCFANDYIAIWSETEKI